MSTDFSRRSVLLVLTCALMVCAFAAWSGPGAENKPPSPYDDAEYKEIIAQQVGSIYDLEALATAVQDDFLPILPPVPELILRQSGGPEVLPFDAKFFPPAFVNSMAGIYENSVPVYPILVVENPTTRALTFYNLDNEPLYTLPPPAGYDPFAFLRSRWPSLFNGGANEAARQNMMQMYDPARIQVRAKLIAADQLALWIYTKRQIEAAQALQSSGGTVELKMMLGGAPNSNIFFTAVKRMTNYVSMTIQYPSGFTNGLDVFTCNDLMAEIWSFGVRNLATTGTNITWLDTNTWVIGGMPTRMYAAGDATMDGDGDGCADAREIMVYGTDPISATSHPVTVSGSVSYSGIETGTIFVVFPTETDSWSLAKSVAIPAPTTYSSDELANNQSYWFKAFRDANGNFALDAWEPRGLYSNAASLVTGNRTGVNITVKDTPSIWGQIGYSGAATGDIHIIAVTASNSWDTTYEATIPYVQGTDSNGAEYYVTFPVNFMLTGIPASNYWIRAFMDADTNGVPTALDPAGQYSSNSIPVSNRVADANVTIAYDSDGDGMPDWWEMKHWSNMSQGSGGDTDADGLTNSAEFAANANPNLADTDGDGMPDKWEVDNSLDPANPLDAGQDADGDGIPNLAEYQFGTKANNADSDGDGLSDYAELYTYFGHVDPMDADSDNDGLTDYAELVTHGTYAGPLGSGAQDSDQDGMSDSNEVARGTNPRRTDTDGDGLDDRYEVDNGWDPLNSATATQNADGDAYNNLTEYQWDYQPTSSNAAPPTSQKLILCPPGSNAVQHSDYFLLAVGDLGALSSRIRVRPLSQGGVLAEQRLYHTQSPGFYINGTAASSVASPINVPASSTAIEYRISSDAGARGTNLYFRLTTTNEPTLTKDSATCFYPELEEVNFWGPGSPNNVDVSFGQTGTLWIGMTANTNDCRVRMRPLQGPNNLYGIGYFHWTDWLLVTVTGTSAVPASATLNALDWQSAYGVWDNDITTRGIRLETGAYAFKAGYDMNGNGTLESTEVQETCSINVPKVESIDATSPIEGTSLNPPPFAGHTPWPFDVTKSVVPGPPDKHLVVFFKDAIDSSFNVQNFDVTLTATVLPSSISADQLGETWSKISGPSSGSLNRSDSFQVKYQNPKTGGVYRFDFDLGISGCPKSEANVVLPLAGAEVDSIISSDIGRANAFATNVLARYSWFQRQRPQNGRRWFVNSGAGDYLGRPDNVSTPTVWAYNQVSTTVDWGRGAVATWKGKPVRVGKISNFLVAYAVRRIGVTSVSAWISQVMIGQLNDSAATKSWDAGWAIAGGATYDTTVAALVVDIWDESDDKNQKLWPNAGGVDNYQERPFFYLPDYHFTSPTFLYMTTP